MAFPGLRTEEEAADAFARWREGVLWMASQGVTELVEIGAGKVLCGLARRIDKSLGAKAVNGPDDAKAVAAAMGEA